MIRVTRLNGKAFSLNPFLIETVEENPDTVVILNSGKKLIVKESEKEIRSRFAEFMAEAVALGVERTKG